MRNGERARRYHEATKHSVESLRSARHFLDWENQPLPFKIYTEIPGERLPLDPGPSGVSAISAVTSPPPPRHDGDRPDGAALARLLHFSLGIVRRRELGDGRSVYFRTAPCTGALYHVDAYLACGELPDVVPGVYHFGPHDFSLRRLREGDFRRALVDAAGSDAAVDGAPAILVLASTYWRNAWKYQSRAWRHVFWDSGTILAQLLAQAAADGWPAALVTGFADGAVERLLGLEPLREGAVALVPIGSGHPAPQAPAVEPIDPATEPLSRHEIDYPEIREAQAASSLDGGESVRMWRARAAATDERPPTGPTVVLPPPGAESGDPLESVILRRGSSRVFSRKAIPAQALSTMLSLAQARLAADYRADPLRPLVELFLIVHAVDDIPPGAYRVSGGATLERIAEGSFRREAGYLGLGQELPADAAVDVYMLADLDLVLGALGDRGYRAAQLDGAIAGGRIYLGAYAEHLGATGLTFFDDDVARFFGLDPKRWGVMFLVAAGRGARIG